MAAAKWMKIPDRKIIDKTIAALKANNIDAEFVATGQDAKKRVLALIPKGAEVMNMSSVTIDTISLAKELNDPKKFDSVRNQFAAMDKKTQGKEMQRLGAAPEYTVGSAHAVTQDGKVVIASNTGSQLPSYAYGSMHVIWVVGAQKIVKDLDEAMKRIYDYVLPLESERAHKAYGVPGSNVSKMLIVNKEVQTGRIRLIIVGEPLGF